MTLARVRLNTEGQKHERRYGKQYGKSTFGTRRSAGEAPSAVPEWTRRAWGEAVPAGTSGGQARSDGNGSGSTNPRSGAGAPGADCISSGCADCGGRFCDGERLGQVALKGEARGLVARRKGGIGANQDGIRRAHPCAGGSHVSAGRSD